MSGLDGYDILTGSEGDDNNDDVEQQSWGPRSVIFYVTPTRQISRRTRVDPTQHGYRHGICVGFSDIFEKKKFAVACGWFFCWEEEEGKRRKELGLGCIFLFLVGFVIIGLNILLCFWV